MTMLLALPAVAIMIDFGFEQHKSVLNSAIYKTSRLAYSIAAEQYNLTGDAEQLLTVLAQLPDIQNRNVAATSKILSKIHEKSPQYGNIVVSDRSGDVWASALPQTKAFSLKNKRTFQDTYKYRKFSTGEYGVGRISALPTIGFGYPLINSKGEFNGVIAANINFLRFNDLIRNAGLPAGSSFTIIDRNGIIIDRNLEPEKYIGRKDKAEIFDLMRNGPAEGSFTDNGLRGMKQIISYNALRLHNDKTPYLYIRVGTSLNDSLMNARLQLFRYMAILSSFLLFAIAMAITVGKTCFLDRVHKLRDASRQIADGDRLVTVSTSIGGGELGDLGHAFDEMSQQIASREHALELSITEREKIISELQEAIAEINILSGMLPICSYCKKIRDDEGYWNQLEAYISKHSEVQFSHGICPDCAVKVFKEIEDMQHPR